MSKKQKVEVISVSPEQLQEFKAPEATQSHNPIPYGVFRENVIDVTNKLITPAGYTLHSEDYKAREDGSQMFGTLTWSNGLETDMGFAIGIRSSYDKTIAAGLVMGAKVFVCSNMMFNGDITIMRKNTTNCIQDMKTSIVTALFGCVDHYTRFKEIVAGWKDKGISDRNVEEMFGHAFCNGVLKPQQLTEAWRQWTQPYYDEFKPRTVYSLYQAMNVPLKTMPPISIIDAHTNLNKMFEERYAI